MSTKIDVRLVGQSIRQLRLSKHWTQEDLADRSFYSVRNIRRIETNGTGSIDIVNTFAGIFEVSAFDILEGVSFFICCHRCSTHHIHRSLRSLLSFEAIFLSCLVKEGSYRKTC